MKRLIFGIVIVAAVGVFAFSVYNRTGGGALAPAVSEEITSSCGGNCSPWCEETCPEKASAGSERPLSQAETKSASAGKCSEDCKGHPDCKCGEKCKHNPGCECPENCRDDCPGDCEKLCRSKGDCPGPCPGHAESTSKRQCQRQCAGKKAKAGAL